MNRDFDTIEKKTLFRRLCTTVTALLLVVLLGFGGDAVGVIAEAADADSCPLEAVSLAEEQLVLRVAPRTRAQTKKLDVASLWQEASSPRARAIAAEGQVAFALMNGGRPRALHPTGPPTGRV